MNKLYMNIKIFILLSLVALASACNEEGITTLVIEDGQPNVAKMIIGQWKPNNAEKADKNGNIIERPSITDMPNLNFNENGLGHFGNNDTGNNESNNFVWSVDEGENIGGSGSGYDEKGPSITFNDERWYIFQLTKSLLIIYRVTDQYILIYYYHRVSDYNEDNQGTKPNTPTIHRISKIEFNNPRFDRHIYTFLYNENGQLKNIKIKFGDNEKVTYDISYIYGNNEILISTNGYNNYKGILNKDGYVQTILQQESTGEEWNDHTVFTYNSNGQMATSGEYIIMEYINENRVSVHSYNKNYTIDYSKEENQTIPDLNDFISTFYCASTLSIAKFHPFSVPYIFGKPSKNLILQENSSESCYKYTYKKDEKGRITQVIQTYIDIKGNSSELESTYNITYQDRNN